MMTAEAYKLYAISDIEPLFREALNAALFDHQRMVDIHRRQHEPAYQAYLNRDEKGRPKYTPFTQDEKERLLYVSWPLIAQLLFPKLRGKPLITGAEVLDQSTLKNDRKNLATRISNRFKLYAWKHWAKDDSKYLESASQKNTALYTADAAWRSLAFDTPQKPFAIMRIEETLSFLEELKTQQAVDGCETPYVYLTGTEYTELNHAFNKGDIDLISFASQPIRFSHVSRDLRENMKDLFDGYKKLLQPCGPLENTEQPQLLEAVKDTLRVDTYGEFLLDFAASNNVAYHMKHRPKDYTPSIHDAGAFISGLDVVLIEVDPEKIGDHATNLGHELRHHWQNITFADFYKEHNTDVDKVVGQFEIFFL